MIFKRGVYGRGSVFGTQVDFGPRAPNATLSLVQVQGILCFKHKEEASDTHPKVVKSVCSQLHINTEN